MPIIYDALDQLVMVKGDVPHAVQGTATTVSASIADFITEATSFRLVNLSATIRLYYSIDDGTVWLTCFPLTTIVRPGHFRSILVKTTSGTAPYDCEYTKAQ